MANTIDPNMGFTIPGVLSEPGPDYAAEINGSLTTIGAHDHTPGKGVLVPVAGLNINADFPLNGNNLNAARSLRVQNSGFILNGSDDKNEFYAFNGDAYFNNSAGTPIKLTTGSTVNAANSLYSPLQVFSNYTILNTGTYNFFEIDTSSGALTINLPACNVTTQGKFYIFKDVTGGAYNNNVTINAVGSDRIDSAVYIALNKNYGCLELVCDGVSNWSVRYSALRQWIDGSFGTFGAPTSIQGTITSITSTGSNALNVGASGNFLNFDGFGFTFAYHAGNSLTVNCATTNIGGTNIFISPTSGTTVSTPFLLTNTAPLVCQAVTNFLANCVIGTTSGNQLNVNSTATFFANVIIQGTITATTTSTTLKTLTVTGSTILGTSSSDTLINNATTTFNSPLTIATTSNFLGAVTLGSTSTLSGQMTVNAPIVPNFGYTFGRHVDRIYYSSLPVPTLNISPCNPSSGYDVLYIPDGGTPGTNTWTINNDGTYAAVKGDTFKIVNAHSTTDVTVAATSGFGTLTAVHLKTTTYMYTDTPSSPGTYLWRVMSQV